MDSGELDDLMREWMIELKYRLKCVFAGHCWTKGLEGEHWDRPVLICGRCRKVKR